MTDFPKERPFVLVANTPSGQLAVQAPQTANNPLTLQTFDSSFNTKTQQFVLRMQITEDDHDNIMLSCGPAFVNLGTQSEGLNTYCSVTAMGTNQELLMHTWNRPPVAIYMDSWSLVPAGPSEGLIQIVLPAIGGCGWTAGGREGDPILLAGDSNANSAWGVIFVADDKVSGPMPPEQRFALQTTGEGENAIESSAGPGQGLSLRAFDRSSPLQQFVLRMQNNANSSGDVIACGTSFVSLGSLTANSVQNSVLSQGGDGGNPLPLLMEPWVQDSLSQDAWCPICLPGDGIRIVQAASPGWSWNDWSGQGKVGDPIYLWNDIAENSVWAVQLL